LLLTAVSSSRRVQRRTHFQAPSHVRYTLMSAPLSKDLRKKHGVRSMPVRKDDEVVIVRGAHKKEKGKVIAVYRKKWCLHIEKITKTKANGTHTWETFNHDGGKNRNGQNARAKLFFLDSLSFLFFRAGRLDFLRI
jgi:ribosomal protein uL24